ncbi:MAG: hypothetical protein ACUVQ0_04180 [Thermoproteota archaeon]
MDETSIILMRIASSLFAKNAASAKKVLGSYITILKENEILKNERKIVFSEARFRARIMLIVNASLMGFLSAAKPVFMLYYTMASSLTIEQDLLYLAYLLLYTLNISILLHYSLAYRSLAKTLIYSIISFTIPFLLFNSLIGVFTSSIPH